MFVLARMARSTVYSESRMSLSDLREVETWKKDKILYGGKSDDVSDWLAVTSDPKLSLNFRLRKSASNPQLINLIPIFNA